MAFYSGSSGKVTVGSTDLNVQQWSIEPTADLDETTHSGSGGYFAAVVAKKKLTGSVQMQWDAAANPTTNPPNLNAGETVALKLYQHSTASAYWNIASAIITSTPIVTKPKEGPVVTFEFRFTAISTWTAPLGNW